MIRQLKSGKAINKALQEGGDVKWDILHDTAHYYVVEGDLPICSTCRHNVPQYMCPLRLEPKEKCWEAPDEYDESVAGHRHGEEGE